MLTAFTRILVPLDGSARAERSILVAAKVARTLGGSIALVRVIPPQIAYGPAFAGVPVAPVSPLPADEEYAEVAGYLTRIAGWPVLSGIPVETQTLVGPIAPTLLDVAQTQRADAIILTSHGRTGISRWVLGSVAQHLAQHASVPTLILREHGMSLADEREQSKSSSGYRILVPLDGSSLAEEALAPAVQFVSALAAPAQAALHLVFAASPYDEHVRGLPTGLAAQGPEAYLSVVAQRLTREHSDLAVTWSVIVTVDTVEGIVHLAETGRDPAGAQSLEQCDVIAMATHGRSGLTRWMMGSVTQRVMQTTNVPLLIVRPRHVSDASELTRKERDTAKEYAWSALF